MTGVNICTETSLAVCMRAHFCFKKDRGAPGHIYLRPLFVKPAANGSLALICGFLFIESFPQMCFEGKWLQNRLRGDEK